jgi:hypothetical protein
VAKHGVYGGICVFGCDLDGRMAAGEYAKYLVSETLAD